MRAKHSLNWLLLLISYPLLSFTHLPVCSPTLHTTIWERLALFALPAIPTLWASKHANRLQSSDRCSLSLIFSVWRVETPTSPIATLIGKHVCLCVCVCVSLGETCLSVSVPLTLVRCSSVSSMHFSNSFFKTAATNDRCVCVSNFDHLVSMCWVYEVKKAATLDENHSIHWPANWRVHLFLYLLLST